MPPEQHVPGVPEDRSHIRTYARDVERLTGTARQPIKAAPPVTVPLPPDVPRPTPPPVVPKPIEPEAPLPTLPTLTKKPASPVTNSPIHTYASDVAEHRQDNEVSRIAMVAAEQDAAPRTSVVVPKEKRSSVFLVVAGIVLLIAGSVSMYAAYRFATGTPPLPEGILIPSLIFADERIQVAGSKDALREALGTGAPLEEGRVAVLYMTYPTTTEAGLIEQVASGRELFAALRLPAPEILLRNIEDSSTIGLVTAGGETRPFFILRVSSFDRTYAGMLVWEASMERDLLFMYPPYPSIETSTSSPLQAPAGDQFRLSFVDEVIENRDMRVLHDADGRTLMLYGYWDKQTLIIARNTAALTELMGRLRSTDVK